MSQGVRKTHQKRSAETRDKLLSALESLLQEKDFADIGVAEIAQKAGVSAASIYRRFNKKEGFIPVLFDLYQARLDEWVKSPDAKLEIDTEDLRGTLRQIAIGGWTQLEQQAHIMRAIHIHGRRRLDLMDQKIESFQESTLAAMRSIVQLFENQIKRKDHEKTARMLAYFFNSILLEKGLFGDDGAHFGVPSNGPEFAVEVADFAYGYLQTPDSI